MKFTDYTKPFVALARANPKLAAGFGVSALTLPAFASNDERGYVRTSLLTTPALAGAFLATPQAIGAGAVFARHAKDLYRAAPKFMHGDFLGSVGERGIGASAFEQMGASFYARTIGRSNQPIDSSIVFGAVNKLRGDTTRRRLLSNAISAARIRALNPSQLAGETVPTVFDLLSDTDMDKILGEFKGNQVFMRDLNARLRNITRLRDPGFSLTSSAAAAPLAYEPVTAGSVTKSGAFQKLLKSRPQAAQELKNALERGWVEEANIISEMVASGQTGRVLAVSVEKQLAGGNIKSLTIPIVDPATGTVKIGSRLELEGIGRHIYSDTDVRLIDEWALGNLNKDWRALQSDITRGAYFHFNDPLSDWKTAGSPHIRLNPHSSLLRSLAAVPTDLGLAGFENRPLSVLDKAEQMTFLKTASKLGLVATGSEGAFVSKYAMQIRRSGLFTIGGLANPEKQGGFWRSFTKPFSLVKVPGGMKPLLSTTAVSRFLGTDVPEIGVRMGAITPQMKTLFGDLPMHSNSLGHKGVKSRAIAAIISDSQGKLSEKQASKIWMQLRSKYLNNDSYLRAVRQAGVLGEGTTIVTKNLGGAKVGAGATYMVDELAINKSTKFLTKDTVIGLAGGGPLTIGSDTAEITSIRETGEGKFAVDVLEMFSPHSGMKGEIGGVKTQFHVMHQDELSKMKEVMNAYSGMIGRGDRLTSDVNVISTLHYTQNKLEAFQSAVSAGIDIAQRASKHGSTGLTDGFMNMLRNNGFIQSEGQWLEDSALLEGMTNEQLGERMKAVTQGIESYTQGVAQEVRKGNYMNDELFAAFKKSGQTDLLQYTYQNNVPLALRIWNSSKINLPDQTAVTFDMLGRLYGSSNYNAAKEIGSRLRYPNGDPMLARELADYLVNGDLSKPLGQMFNLEDVMPPSAFYSLIDPGARAGTLFDPSLEQFNRNFSVNLKSKLGRDYYLPVLGHEAYGGMVTKFSEKQYAIADWERALADIGKATNTQEAEKALSAYHDALNSTLWGKTGFMRSKGNDPRATTGYIRTYASPENPFQVAVGPKLAKELGVHKRLKRGEEVFAALTRHPVREMPLVNVVLDRSIDNNIIAMDEGLRGLLMADDDGDQALLHLLEANESIAEARRQIYDGASIQHGQRRMQELLEGHEGGDLSRNSNITRAENVVQRVQDQISKSKNTAAILEARTSGRTIGAYSNVLTQMMLNLEHNSMFQGDEHARTIMSTLFWDVRQASIAAQKAPGTMNYERAMGYVERLRTNMKTQDGQGVRQSLIEISELFWNPKKKGAYTSDLEAHLGISEQMFTEAAGNVRAAFLKTPQAEELFARYGRGIDPTVNALSELITKDFGSALKRGDRGVLEYTKAFAAMQDLMPYMRTVYGHAGEAKGADRMAAALGSMSERLSAAAHEVRPMMHGSGKLIAAGLGIGAVAGLLTTPMRKNLAPSANEFKPEEQVAGADYIPGEPVAGTHAPSQPLRTVTAPGMGVTTTIVAPMHSQHNVDVQLRGTDSRPQASEKARLISKLTSAGDSNVTINYRGTLNPRSLRFREKMRETKQDFES